ncbi:MAG: GAF domain-containing sensor histidine kinase [Actinomycetota bacterium]
MTAVEDRLRLEHQLIALRWIVAAFGAAQVGFAVRDASEDPGFVVPLGAAIVIGLVCGNLLITRAAGRTGGPDPILGVVAFGLDATALLGLIWIASDGPADPVWVIGYLLPLEGAARWGLPGALIGAGLFLGGELARSLPGGSQVGTPTLAFRAAMAFAIGAVAGMFSSSWRRAAAVASARVHDAEAAAERALAAAERERQARAEVAAFHAAVLVDPDVDHLRTQLQTAAEAIGREIGCESLGILVRRTGQAGDVGFMAVGVLGDPGYLPGQVLAPASDPVAAAAEDGLPVRAGPDMVAPMLVRGTVVGVIHERSPVSEPDADRFRLLVRLADQLGLVLESARLRADQQETVVRLRELDQMKSDFVAITSHELRTPLAGVRGYVDMLRRRGEELTTLEREEYLDIVLLQTDRLIALVDDLLVVSKIEAGMLTLEPEDTEIGSFLARSVRTFGEDATRVVVGRGAGAPERMLVDHRRLAQILTNLVHNALKFSEETVRVTWDAPADGTVAFHVHDQGPGIPLEDRDRIFERFHQGGHANTHSQGFGLGLYITRQLTQAMGGWIEVRSAAGEGTTFTVTLPESRPRPAPAPPPAAAQPGRTAS